MRLPAARWKDPHVKHRIPIRGMAVATAVVAASATMTVGMNNLVGSEQVVAEPAGATLTRIAEKERVAAARKRTAREKAREAREASEARERASRSASRTPTFDGDARGISAGMAAETYGWGADQFSCLDSLWARESGWNHRASNLSSGAYGIPQALPGSKMGAYGSDWRTNPVTQIQWGLAYIDSTYGSPCGAWNAFQSKGWY